MSGTDAAIETERTQIDSEDDHLTSDALWYPCSTVRQTSCSHIQGAEPDTQYAKNCWWYFGGGGGGSGGYDVKTLRNELTILIAKKKLKRSS